MFEVLFKPYNEGEERKGHMKEKRRMISEAARQLGLETYHLRTWEEEFSLTIPRNEKGYRCYGDKEIHTFERIRDMRNAGLHTVFPKNHHIPQSPAPMDPLEPNRPSHTALCLLLDYRFAVKTFRKYHSISGRKTDEYV